MHLVGLPPMGCACSPFTMAVLIRGYVSFLGDMMVKQQPQSPVPLLLLGLERGL